MAQPVPLPRNPPDEPEAEATASAGPQLPPQSAARPLSPSAPDAMDTQSDDSRPHARSSTPPPPGLESPLEFTTPKPLLCAALMGPSGSTTRSSRPNLLETKSLPYFWRTVGLGPVNVSQLIPFTWGRAPLTLFDNCSKQQPRELGCVSLPLNSFASAKCTPDTVCLQDPSFWRSRLSPFQNYTLFTPPGGSGSKPKVAFYVSIFLLAQAMVLPAFSTDLMWPPSTCSELTCSESRSLISEF